MIYLIHGFIGSGKTTFSKRLAKEKNAVRFTPDEVISKRYGRSLSIQEIRNANLTVKKEIWDKVKKIVKQKKDVILDYGFWKKEQRIAMTNKIKNLGEQFIFYEILCDPIIMKQRALQRKKDSDIAITSERYDMYYKRFEPMTDDEDRITVWTDSVCNG